MSFGNSELKEERVAGVKKPLRATHIMARY